VTSKKNGRFKRWLLAVAIVVVFYLGPWRPPAPRVEPDYY
jgi:hypothetical protein